MKGSAGDPLPPVFETLANRGTDILRGQLTLIAAAPGVGKSAFVLTYAVKSRVPTMYFSADSDAFTQTSRILSIELGWPLAKSVAAVREENLPREADVLADVPIRFNYAANPTLDEIELGLEAYSEVYGDYPALIVVDNVTNVITGVASNDEDPFAGLEALMDYLHDLARQTGAAVIGLHHVNGDYNNGERLIPINGIKGQITRVPELVLTLFRPQTQFGSQSLNVSTVKNRGGKADASGKSYAELEFIGDSMTIRDYQ